MKITCDIIKDLLPSYVDELLTEDSHKMVEEHLDQCQSCREYYEALKGDDNIFADEAETLQEARLEELKPLTKIKKKMNRRALIASVISVVCAGALAFGAYFLFFHYEMYTPYEEAGITVTEGGQLYLEEAFYGTANHSFSNEHITFFFVTDSFATQHKERKEDEKNIWEEDFSRSTGTISENVAGEIVQREDYIENAYYPPKEYAEKLQDRDFMVSMSTEEEAAFLEEMKAASVLLWERPKFVNEEADSMVSVRFTASVESLIEDKNTGTGEIRYAVVELFQGHPFVIDVGRKLGKDLKVGETYSFKMKDKMVKSVSQTYDLEAIISLYELELESISKPTVDQMGLDAVEIVYKKL